MTLVIVSNKTRVGGMRSHLGNKIFRRNARLKKTAICLRLNTKYEIMISHIINILFS